MKISTKGRYALRLMIDLASGDSDKFISLRTIAEKNGISDKYLEQITTILCRAGYVKSTRGVMGGYKLSRAPEEYTVGEILRLIEGSLVPVACMEDEPNRCPQSAKCVTLEVWKRIDTAVNDVIDNISLADLVSMQQEKLEAILEPT